MLPSALLHLYRRRLRSHGPQELLAGAGIAIAVALVFAAMLSQSSIESSAARVVRTVTGPASLQLRARGEEGLHEALLARVKRLPGVRNAAPLLEETASLRGAGGRQVRVQVAGADLRLAVLDGLAETLPIAALSSDGIGISATVAGALRDGPAIVKGDVLTVRLRGRTVRLPVTEVLGRQAAGALAGAYAAVMPLARMQRLAGLPGRVSRIFVQTRPGRRAAVRAELTRLADGREEVAAADQDVRLLSQALGPSRLATGLFAAIGALLGFLLAFNAMLLTVADRRRTIADLRISGAGRGSIVEMVLFEALCLGAPASLLGLALGYELSTGVFHQSTKYLAEAFILSGATSAQAQTIALPLLGGVLATCAASMVPLLDLRRGRARDAIYEDSGVPGHGLSRSSKLRLAAAALFLVAVASVLWIVSPSAAIPATALLALATVLCVPLTFSVVLRAAAAIGERVQALSILPLALASLKATAIRSLALAATGAVALFGSVALGGARQNLIDGIGAFARGYVADAQIWVSTPGDNQAGDSFAAGSLPARIARVPGVVAVQRFQGGFVQLGSRRVWVIARPGDAERHVLASQLRSGTLGTALAQIARGGWIAVSQQIAAERHVRLGGTLVLPTPSGPRPFRVAATTSNLAWPPGVIFMSSAAFGAAWQTGDPTTLGVQLAPGASATQARQAIAAVVAAAGAGLEVSLASTRAARIGQLTSEGLGQLRQVSTMLLVAAIVAMFAALVSSVWQRRAGLAGLRLFGAGTLSLQCILAIEALLMLGAGCLTGALAGVYGQVVIDAFLRHVTGFPLESPAASLRPLQIFAFVLVAAMLLGAIPGAIAARVRPALAIANE
jgi:putative ABC transport system permease protein